jgi:prespore-specific regulator
VKEWTKEEENILTKEVLRHIREGSTIVKALEEVGARINRTPASCGFHWNAVVSKEQYYAITMAKKKRHETKKRKSRRI